VVPWLPFSIFLRLEPSSYVIYHGGIPLHASVHFQSTAHLALAHLLRNGYPIMTSKTILKAEQVFDKSNEIVSINGRFKLNLQADGNLVVYDTDTASTIWTGRTEQSDASFLEMQQDGNLVLYSSDGSPRWASDTFGKCSHPYLTLQNDGTLAMYAHDKQGIIWSSFTERSRLGMSQSYDGSKDL
jgi:hypothetical protein